MSLEENIFMAQVAEQADMYRDVVDFLKPVVKEKGSKISEQERNLLSLAFKCLVHQQRFAIRNISAIEANQKEAKFAENM